MRGGRDIEMDGRRRWREEGEEEGKGAIVSCR